MMNRFLIEREIEGAAGLTQEQVYCLHEAEDAETILEHSRRAGFPANLVSVVASEFGPHTAEVGTSAARA